MNWLTEALGPAVVGLAQLAVVTAALAVARIAKRRAAYLEGVLDGLLGDAPKPSGSSSSMPPPLPLLDPLERAK